MRRCALAFASLFAGLACGGGCTKTGSVHLAIDVPTDGALTPIDDRVASLTLTIDKDGQAPVTLVQPAGVRGQPLDFGQIPIEDGVRLSLAATSQSGRMVGYGRDVQAIDVKRDQDLSVPIRLRRPFAYLSGAGTLQVFDTTRENGQPYQTSIDSGGAPDVVAATPDGASIVVISGSSANLVATVSHTKVDLPPVPIMPGATKLLITADARFAVAIHGGATPGLTVIDLAAMAAGMGGSSSDFTAISPAPADLAVTNDTAYVLINAADTGCATPSSIVPVPMVSPLTPEPAVPVGQPVNRIAADARSGVLVVVEPCRGMAVRVAPIAGEIGTPTDLVAVPSPTAIAIDAGVVWVAGHGGGTNAGHITLASVPIDGGMPSVFDLPPAEEKAVSDDFNMPGQSAVLQMIADDEAAIEMSVLPDGTHVALTVHALYHADRSGSFLGQPILPAIDVDTSEYQLIDVGARLPVQRMRTVCSIQWTHDAVLDAFTCGQAAGQDLAPTPFGPKSLTVLYGDR